MENLGLLDIAVVIEQIERSVAFGTEIAPLALQPSDQVFLITVIEFARPIRPTFHDDRREQLGLLIDTHLQVCLDAVEVA